MIKNNKSPKGPYNNVKMKHGICNKCGISNWVASDFINSPTIKSNAK